MSEKPDTPRTGHTEGPWWFDAHAGKGYVAITSDQRVADQIDDIAVIELTDFVKAYDDEQLANARLIAAAPDLLRALEVEAEWHESESEELAKFSMEARIKNHRDRAASIRAALAKAKGGTP